jgi:hypothetical protein
VPLVLSTVVLVIQTLHILLGVTLGLDSVVFVQALGFDELVDFGADEADESLFGEGVGDWLSCLQVSICSSNCVVVSCYWGVRRTLLAAVVFKGLEGLEAGGTGDQLVGELALVLAAVDLLVRVLRVV